MMARREQQAVQNAGVVHGAYVYGILHESAALPADLPSVGEEDLGVHLATHGRLVALISEVHLIRPLGTRDDLLAHEQVLDTLAADVTVLPMRFGAVVRDPESVVDELLKPHRAMVGPEPVASARPAGALRLPAEQLTWVCSRES